MKYITKRFKITALFLYKILEKDLYPIYSRPTL